MQDVLNADWVGVLWDDGDKGFLVRRPHQRFVLIYPLNEEAIICEEPTPILDLFNFSRMEKIIIFDSAEDRLRWLLE